MSNIFGFWPWRAYRNKLGYGQFKVNCKTRVASRLAKLDWSDLENPCFVLHRCDNSACCRPSHLFLGNATDNMVDRDAKGRQARGERSNLAKLNSAQVIAIRTRILNGERAVDIARQYGIHRNLVYDIIKGRTWKHLKD